MMDCVGDKEKRRGRDTQWYDIVVHCNWIGWGAETMSAERLEWDLIDGENIAKWVFKHEKLWIIKRASAEPLERPLDALPLFAVKDQWCGRENHGRKYLTINFDGNLGVWLPRRRSVPTCLLSTNKPAIACLPSRCIHCCRGNERASPH